MHSGGLRRLRQTLSDCWSRPATRPTPAKPEPASPGPTAARGLPTPSEALERLSASVARWARPAPKPEAEPTPEALPTPSESLRRLSATVGRWSSPTAAEAQTPNQEESDEATPRRRTPSDTLRRVRDTVSSVVRRRAAAAAAAWPTPAPGSRAARVSAALGPVVRLHDPRRPTRGHRIRARCLLALLFLAYGALAYRCYTIQVEGHERWAAAAAAQQVRVRTIPPERGRILFRESERLVPAAVSLERGSLLVEGRDDRDVPAFLLQLEEALGGLTVDERAYALERLHAGRAFYLRRRRLTPEDMERVRAARLPRVNVEEESVRVHPFGALGAQFLGLVDAEGRGATALEALFEEELKGTPGRREVRLDNLRRELVGPGLVLEPPAPGQDVVLSVHRSIQAVVQAELAALAEEHEPEGAAAVVVDPRTGDILGMGSWPFVDPDDLGPGFQDGLRNRCLTDSYEPGSTMKPLLVGTAWELGLGGPDRAIHCPLTYHLPGRRKAIVDSHHVGHVREEDVIVQSSNTGAVKITARLSPDQIRGALAGFGLGDRSGLGLPGETPGNVRSLQDLRPTTLGSVAQGYAVSVTPVQMAMAYAALANGGILYRPRLVQEVRDRAGEVVRRFPPQAISRPLSAATARDALRDALVRVVNDDTGTARRARSDTYTIAGKTGTTKLLVDGRYHEREVVASFCGFAPAEDARIAFCVVAWAPSTKKRRAWGGTVAAPCAGRIAEQVLRILRVPGKPADEPN